MPWEQDYHSRNHPYRPGGRRHFYHRRLHCLPAPTRHSASLTSCIICANMLGIQLYHHLPHSAVCHEHGPHLHGRGRSWGGLWNGILPIFCSTVWRSIQLCLGQAWDLSHGRVCYHPGSRRGRLTTPRKLPPRAHTGAGARLSATLCHPTRLATLLPHCVCTTLLLATRALSTNNRGCLAASGGVCRGMTLAPACSKAWFEELWAPSPPLAPRPTAAAAHAARRATSYVVLLPA